MVGGIVALLLSATVLSTRLTWGHHRRCTRKYPSIIIMLPIFVLLSLTCIFSPSNSFTGVYQSCSLLRKSCYKTGLHTLFGRRNPIVLATPNDGPSSTPDIDELYRQAMEDDAEWFRTYVSIDLLGQEQKSTSKNTTSVSVAPPVESAIKQNEPETRNAKEQQQEEEREDTQLKAKEEEMIDETLDSFVVSTQQKLEALGYTEDEISRINPHAVERILQNEIPPFRREKGELRSNEKVEEEEEEEERLRPPRPPQKGVRRRPVDEDFNGGEEGEVIRRQRQKRSQGERSIPKRPSYVDSDMGYRTDRPRSTGSYRSASKQRAMSKERATRALRKREDEELTGTRWWPGLAPFREALRSETYFRASILGPKFKGALKKEGKWRYQLYKDWLKLLKSGVGSEDMIVPLSAYNDLQAGNEPSERRRRSKGRDETLEDERGRKVEEMRRRKREEILRRNATSDENSRRKGNTERFRGAASRLGNDDSL